MTDTRDAATSKGAVHGAGLARLRTIREELGTPAWECEGVLIYGGDCIDLMDRLTPELVDLTVTSPPYNIGKEYERPLPLEEYLDWCAQWTCGIYRLTTANGAFWLNLGYVPLPGRAKAIPIPYLLWSRIPFFLIQEIVWNYGAGVAGSKFFSPRNEKWLWYAKDPLQYTFNLDAVRDPNVKYPNQRKNGKIRVNPLGKNPGDVWQIAKVTTGEGMTGRRASPERTAHPSQFPEEVIRRIVLAASDPGDLVMDPFGGSGTTAAVALATGRMALLFEVEPRYIDVAARRLERAERLSKVSQARMLG